MFNRSGERNTGVAFRTGSARGIAACFLLVLGLLVCAISGSAQALYGTLRGDVTDPSGAAVPGAKVEAQNVGTNTIKSTTTDEGGLYRFNTLEPGVYKITVSAQNFANHVRENVRIDANTVRRVDVELKVSQVSETVTVVAAASELKTDTAEVSAQIEKKEINNLPITSSKGRSFQSLYRILPGFTPPSESNSDAGNPQRAMTSNVNGQSTQSIHTRIDGATDAYPWLPANVAYVPPADAVESVSIVTNSFDAEQGMAGGAAVNVQIKSGTNEYHGSAHLFHTDNALRAKAYFTPANFRKPKDILNQFGGTIGGPVLKNKLFFFWDWETTLQRRFASSTRTVPNPAAIFDAAGNAVLTSSITPPAGFVFTDCNATPTNGCIFDPNTGAANGTGRTAFPNNIIPANRIDPAARTMLSRIDTSGFINTLGPTATSNYIANRVFKFDRDNMDAKVNWLPNSKSSVFGRYSYSGSLIVDPPGLGDAGGDAVAGGQNGEAHSRIQIVGIGGTYTITPTMLWDANIGYTRQRIDAKNFDIALGAFGLNTLRIPGTNGPDELQGGIPSFQVTGYANMGNPNTGNPFLFRDNQWVFNTNLGWTKGRHDIRFGMEWGYSDINHFQPQGGAFQTARGTFQFNGAGTVRSGGGAPGANSINSLAQFLLGLPGRAGIAIQNVNPNTLRFSEWSAYARDRWQITPRLTFTLGVRWEFYPMGTSDHSGLRVFNPATGNVLIGGLSGTPEDGGVETGIGRFHPRLGGAWRITKSTVLRAGWGTSSDNNNYRFLRNSFPAVTNSDQNPGGNNIATRLTTSSLATCCAPYPTLPTGILPVVLPNISSGVVPLPDGVGTTTIKRDFNRGYAHSYNVTLQQEFWGFIGEAGYVGTRGIRPLTNMNINPGQLGGGQNSRVLNVQFNHLTTVTNPATGAPFLGWSDINQLTPFRESYYDSLQTRLTRRFGGASMIGVVYVWSHAINYQDNEELSFLRWPFPAYFDRNKATAGYDRLYNFQFYGVYELPFGKNQRWARTGVANAILGGWQTNWVLSRVGGTPLTLTDDSAAAAQFNAPGNSQLPDVVGPIVILGGIGPRPGQANCTAAACRYFDTTAFARVTTGAPRFGTSVRSVLRGPGFFNLDISLFRDFTITERIKFQFRTEWFNSTNTPRFGNPGTNIANAATFGVITSASNERQIWFGGKFTF